MKKFHPLIARILIMTASGFLLISVAGTYTPPSYLAPPPSVSQQETELPEKNISFSITDEADAGLKKASLPVRIMDALNRFKDKSEAALSKMDISRETHYAPSVLQYNLMALFPEEQELSPDDEMVSLKEKVIRLMKYNLKPFYDFFKLSFRSRAADSYGGQMYDYLNRKDAEWTSGLYRWLQASPEQAAGMMKLSRASVTGKYDPTNEKHDPANPSSWLIPSWKNVSFNFYDGDGNKTDLYSNAQEIASMASVYTWYSDWRDVDNFRNYIDELWQLSHKYSVSISPVYYCAGCVDPSEAEKKDSVKPEKSSSMEEGTSSGDNHSSGPAEAAPETSAKTSASSGQEGQNEALDASQDYEVSQTANQQAASPSELSGPSDEIVAAAADGKTGGSLTEDSAADGGGETAAPEIQLNSEGKFCPGHIDLNITARITGISEQKNLYTLDKRGSVKTDTWAGWSAYNKAYVERLDGRDWLADYNLSPIELALGKPLTFTEINEYLKLLPSDISKERKAVITYALHSVGKIPYYYGGKARTSGYEGNHFASLTSPDRKGRIISGLDCSGWVNWVYWSSLGEAPTNFGTSGLVHAGKAISRSELKPGDIIIRLGVNSHVVMFLAWASNGQMICIHETGGNVSNVTVSVVDDRWPYYRSLLD